jgi:tetratricopeptide (TPR) repeat protein
VLALSCAFNPSGAQETNIVDSLKRVLNSSNESVTKINTLLSLSVEMEGSDPKQSLLFGQQAYTLAETLDSEIWKVRSKIRIGACYINMNDYSTALKFMDEAKTLAEEMKIKRELAMALGNLAIIYGAMGDYGLSSKYDFQSLALFEEVNDKNQIGVTFGNIGSDFLIQGNYEKALEYLFKSLLIAQEINDKPGIAAQYNNIAGVYLESFKDYKKALHYYYQAITVNRNLRNNFQVATNSLNIGLAHFNLNQNDSALYYYLNALDIFPTLSSPLSLAGCQILLGDYYCRVNNINKGLGFALLALEIGQSQNSVETIRNAAAVLHKLYLKKDDFRNAYKYTIIEVQAKDTLYYQQNKKELLKLEFQYNNDKIEKVRLIKQQKKNYLIGFVMFGLVSGIVIVVLINSRQRIKVKNTLLEKLTVEKELNFKKEELSINLMALMKKNELLSYISEKLIQIENHNINSETKDAINKISHELRHSTDDKIWKEFSIRFQEVHNEFYKALLQKFPSLSQNELKLCAYLRLNMSTKEIAELTGQRVLTIEHARYKLRKKLGISNSEVNLVNLLTQINI